MRESAANEAIILRTAAHCGLRTAQVFYEPLTRACVVERFDHYRRDDGTLGRRIQYDFCQLAGIASERKYEKEGGQGRGGLRRCRDWRNSSAWGIVTCNPWRGRWRLVWATENFQADCGKTKKRKSSAADDQQPLHGCMTS